MWRLATHIEDFWPWIVPKLETKLLKVWRVARPKFFHLGLLKLRFKPGVLSMCGLPSFISLLQNDATWGPYTVYWHTGCVLEEGDVASEEVLKRLNSRTSRQNSLRQTQTQSPHVGHNQGSEPLLGNPKELPQWSFPVSKLLLLSLVWFAFFAVQILRGGKSGAVSNQ